MTVKTKQKYTFGYSSSDVHSTHFWLNELSSDSLFLGGGLLESADEQTKTTLNKSFKENKKPQLALHEASKVVKNFGCNDYVLVYLKDRRLWHTRNGNIRLFVYRDGRFLSPPHTKNPAVATPFLLNEDDQLVVCNASLLFETAPKSLKDIFSSSLPQESAEGLIQQTKEDLSFVGILPCEFLRDNAPSRNREKALQEVFPFEKEADEALRNPNQKKNQIYNFVGFVLFTLLIIFMYQQNKSNWESQIQEKDDEIANIKKENTKSEKTIEAFQRYQTQHIQSIANRDFDVFDNERYRMYALFRDARKKFKREEIAEKFNIYNPLAIEAKVVMDENWFIVPVKGTHLVQKGETLKKIAQMYYDNEQEGIKLIQEFNPQVVEGHSVFLPFENEL
ncbi:LysM peptidoglycan-binding domain-containing protein [Flammeovirga sp. MY04]|uniref:LysM peptidoglycan-binding domain-containing protein n=1 Tax=Flammeovirga sp. MY04 TaxID=1191459 RepID=UPI00080641F3|nr:LysM domain-containing protein [Flammeovirga sp. MY04]ANQ49788.1 LysM peptidoglycan-binding domain-containing protein [Flammeovirga sp. MY04]